MKALDAMVAEIDGEASNEGDASAEGSASAAQTANAPETAGNVSAETNGPETGPETDEIVSAETSDDEPVTVTESTVPRRIGHALRIRDGCCRFPGCGQPPAVDHLSAVRERAERYGKRAAATGRARRSGRRDRCDDGGYGLARRTYGLFHRHRVAIAQRWGGGLKVSIGIEC